MVIKFLLDNNIRREVVKEVLERGFDSLQALLDPEDRISQKIPVGQRRLLLHIAKSLGSNGTTSTSSLGGADSAMPTAATASSNQQSVSSPTTNQPPPASGNNEKPVYHQTLLNTLVSQHAQLATNQTSSMNKDSNSAGNQGPLGVFALIIISILEGLDGGYQELLHVISLKGLRALRGKNGLFRKWFISSYVVAYVILITKSVL